MLISGIVVHWSPTHLLMMSNSKFSELFGQLQLTSGPDDQDLMIRSLDRQISLALRRISVSAVIGLVHSVFI